MIELEYVVRNVMHYLNSDTPSSRSPSSHYPQWGLRVYYSTGPLGNEQFVRHVLKPLGYVSFMPLPFDVTDQVSYNKLLLSEPFWDNFTDVADKVLIFQTDSMMLRYGISTYLQYDFIGAPWSRSYQWLKEANENHILKQGVGNGGFSLRGVKLMLTILWDKSSFHFHEDYEFATRAEKLCENFPHRHIAYTFAVETVCLDIPLDLDVNNGTMSRQLSLDLQTLVNLPPYVPSNATRPVMPTFVPLGVHQIWRYFDYSTALSMIKLSLPSRISHAQP